MFDLLWAAGLFLLGDFRMTDGLKVAAGDNLRRLSAHGDCIRLTQYAVRSR